MRTLIRCKPLLLMVLLVPALASSPGCLYDKLENAECPPDGTDLTYDNFGKDYLGKYCNYCHGASVLDRQGAPPAYVFDTPEQVEKFADRIYVRSAGRNTSMPPGPDDPPEEERYMLAEWLGCAYGP